MTADGVLTLAWLVLAHLVADFVLQTSGLVRAKTGEAGSAWVGLLLHGGIVALTLLPLGLAFGGPGWAVLVVVAVTHMAIDRLKVVLTRRAEAAALAEARRRHETAGTAPDGLGPAWTPVPAALFAIDQLAHVLVLAGSWLFWLAAAPLEPGWLTTVDGWTVGWDPAVVHAAAVRLVVLTALLIVNVRAGALFVAILVGPRLAGAGPTGSGGGATSSSAPAAAGGSDRPATNTRAGSQMALTSLGVTIWATSTPCSCPFRNAPTQPSFRRRWRSTTSISVRKSGISRWAISHLSGSSMPIR